MRLLAFLVAGLVAVAFPLASAHKFNHEDRHEVCGLYDGPHGHAVGDGHPHTHDAVAAAATTDHDPCKQVRMAYPVVEDQAPLVELTPPRQEIPMEDLLFSDGDPNNTEVFVGGEAYRLAVPTKAVKRASGLAVVSDLQAAGLGFPGTGTRTDPYIIEGYLITGNLLIKDTSKCFVVRNNAIVSRVAVAPLLPDPEKIVDLRALDDEMQLLLDTANAWKAQLDSLLAQWDARKASWDANETAWAAQRAAYDAEAASYAAQAAAWQQAFDDFEADYLAAVRQTERLADDFEAYSGQYGAAAQPARPYASAISGGSVPDMQALQDAFEPYQEDLDGDQSDEDVEGWIIGNVPPDDPPAGFWGDAYDWQNERQVYDSYQADILARIQGYWNDLMPSEPNQTAYAAFVAEHEAWQVEEADFAARHAAFLAQLAGFRADYAAFKVQNDADQAKAGADIRTANDHFAKSALFRFEYRGALGTKLYDTATELVQWVLKVLFNILDIANPNNAAQNTGQLILDWNGQCVHAYNNVAADLRVNQNNDRTGYATGGVIEDNRFFTIGQIRHYDGIFRENEVGNRAHLMQLLKPGVAPSTNSVRSVNNDGANQGWYVDNVFYGQIDLDFHGHHHSAGFFAPTSHYHGSRVGTVKMHDASGRCMATWGDIDMQKHNGPHADHHQDNSIELLGVAVTPGTDRSGECLDHMDHTKRWTSVLFNDNVVIDPNGVGLRFEDRDHRQDDEKANSENVYELKMPHFHQKWVQLERNTVVGKIFVDVVNAAGTNLWSDNWAPASASGPLRTQEALSHPGAEVVNSHPYRNDAWVDINGNTLFLTQPTGIVVADGDDVALLAVKDNRGYGLRSGVAPGMDRPAFLQWLQDARSRGPDDVQAQLDTWGGTDRGVQTLAAFAYLRDGFTVEHCGNAARGLDRSILARDRIYDDGRSIIRACGTNDWGSAQPVDIAYTPAPVPPRVCTQPLREWTGENDDFYSMELVFDAIDAQMRATCPVPQQVPAPTPSSVVATVLGAHEHHG